MLEGIQDQDPGLIHLVEAVGVDMEEEAEGLDHPAAEEVTADRPCRTVDAIWEAEMPQNSQTVLEFSG